MPSQAGHGKDVKAGTEESFVSGSYTSYRLKPDVDFKRLSPEGAVSYTYAEEHW